MKTKTRVAVVQAAPKFMDLEGLIRDAASRGAELVAFPEAWLPGYPAWLDSRRDAGLWDHEPTKNLFARLVENSVVVPSSHTGTLASLSQEFGVVLSIGINERVKEGSGHGTLYNLPVATKKTASEPSGSLPSKSKLFVQRWRSALPSSLCGMWAAKTASTSQYVKGTSIFRGRLPD
jgi:hypothetical protein